MRMVTVIAVMLAVVATALAGVKEQSESRRLQYSIPQLERRRDLLERRIRAAQAGVARALSARSLLTAGAGGGVLGGALPPTPAYAPESTFPDADSVAGGLSEPTEGEAP